MIAPSHGCIWSGKDEVNTILGLYAKWASGKNEGKAVVVYDSMWGATAKMAETVMAEFQDAGIPVTKHCLAVENVSEVMVDFLDAAYVCIGNPTLNNQLFPRVAGFVTYMKGLAPRGKRRLLSVPTAGSRALSNRFSRFTKNSAGRRLPRLRKNILPRRKCWNS